MIQSLEGMDLTDRIREMSGRIAKAAQQHQDGRGDEDRARLTIHHARAWIQRIRSGRSRPRGSRPPGGRYRLYLSLRDPR